MLADWDPPELLAISEAKRVWERLIGDPEARTQFARLGPNEREASPAKRFAPLIDILMYGRAWSDVDAGQWPEIALFRRWQQQLQQHRELLRDYPAYAGTNLRFKAWRAREMARAESELGPRDAALTHPVVAYELSSGCSLGCWFCGISAKKFGGYASHAAYGPLWREVLGVMADTLGQAVRTGVCFGATDPFDNPDYNAFILDHYAITGSLPPTTTAAPLRNLGLTRGLLALAEQNGPVLTRFSLLTRRIMDDVLAEFSARDLLMVELIPQMNGSVMPKADAGRARGRRPKAATIDAMSTTIACVSGFLINLPEQRIRLVSPCRASDAWPDGYRVYADEPFTTGDDFRAAIESIVERCMAPEPPLDRALRFRADLRLTASQAGVRLQNDVTAHHITGDRFIPALAEMLALGDRPLREVVGRVVGDGASLFDVLNAVQRIYDAALLDPTDHGRTVCS
jgi:radical SAM family RiPP maturation amino acid epimerase